MTTTSVRAKLYKPAVGVRVRARSAPAHPLGDETHVTSHYMRTMSHLTRGGIGHFDPDRFSTSFRGCGPLGSERPVLRTGSITLLRYVSLPVQGRSDRVWARGAEDSDRRVRWATTPPAENMRARALSCRSSALSGPGPHDVGADLADPRARVALHRLQGGEYHLHWRGRGWHLVRALCPRRDVRGVGF